jgi:HPt (histidine-containing phosphotransfer) domain-containing protein
MPTGTSTPANEDLEALRLLFQRRLQDDLLTLGTLASRFASADAASGAVLEEIRLFAHRMHGAAAIFEAHELVRPAQALEDAAASAVSGCAHNTSPSVSSILQSLLEQLSLRIDNRSGAPDKAHLVTTCRTT